ncbi:hypothetical protein AAEP93_002335 [Penicillium crustosum]
MNAQRETTEQLRLAPEMGEPVKLTPKITALSAKNSRLVFHPVTLRGRLAGLTKVASSCVRPNAVHEHGQGEPMVLWKLGFLDPDASTVQFCR